MSCYLSIVSVAFETQLLAESVLHKVLHPTDCATCTTIDPVASENKMLGGCSL